MFDKTEHWYHWVGMLAAQLFRVVSFIDVFFPRHICLISIPVHNGVDERGKQITFCCRYHIRPNILTVHLKKNMEQCQEICSLHTKICFSRQQSNCLTLVVSFGDWHKTTEKWCQLFNTRWQHFSCSTLIKLQ